jgi:hypothetical protein
MPILHRAISVHNQLLHATSSPISGYPRYGEVACVVNQAFRLN